MSNKKEQVLCCIFSQTNLVWMTKTVRFYASYRAAKSAIRCFRRHKIGCAPYALASNDPTLKGVKNKPKHGYAVMIYRKA